MSVDCRSKCVWVSMRKRPRFVNAYLLFVSPCEAFCEFIAKENTAKRVARLEKRGETERERERERD